MDDKLIQAQNSRLASLKDKLKKRRQALGSILGHQPSSITTAKSPIKESERCNPSLLSPEKVEDERSKTEAKIDTSPPAKKQNLSGSSFSPLKSVPSISSTRNADDVMSLLSRESAKERQEKAHRQEILELLSKPTAKEQTLMDTFRSVHGGGVREFCSYSTKAECTKNRKLRDKNYDPKVICTKVHFMKIIQSHTDESLGDCSFLNTCFHMGTCKYIHYKVDNDEAVPNSSLINSTTNRDQLLTKSSARSFLAQESRLREKNSGGAGKLVQSRHLLESVKLSPPQWVQCDLRNFDLSVLGKFAVVMADPPWDIHMELPYGTMADDEMRQLPVPTLQEEGLIFLWVTGRAMELGRECLKLWGYERVDEIIWVKTNQLQRIIRTGRTGHWLNHGKEHCLVGLKKKSDGSECSYTFNKGLDCDVIVAEVRATSHKPDEIYGIIERLSPGTRKLELFGRPHNVQPNWVTLGNQLDGIVIHDERIMERWHESYPNGYDLVPGHTLHPRKSP